GRGGRKADAARAADLEARQQRKRPAARTRSVREDPAIADAVVEEDRAAILERRDHDLPRLAGGERPPVAVHDAEGTEVDVEMEAVASFALEPDRPRFHRAVDRV